MNKNIKNDLLDVYNRLSNINAKTWESESELIKKNIEKIISEIEKLEKQSLEELAEEKNKKIAVSSITKCECKSEYKKEKAKKLNSKNPNKFIKAITSPLFISVSLASLVALTITLLLIF